MERLTEKCWRNLDPWECCGQDKYCQHGCHDEGGCTNGCIVPKLYSRLAKYEDAEEQGLLFKTPFKIGQPIWFCGNELINDYVIRQFIVTEDGVEAVKISKLIDGKEYWNTFYTEQWLVSVFPTKAEAEKKLTEMKGGVI